MGPNVSLESFVYIRLLRWEICHLSKVWRKVSGVVYLVIGEAPWEPTFVPKSEASHLREVAEFLHTDDAAGLQCGDDHLVLLHKPGIAGGHLARLALNQCLQCLIHHLNKTTCEVGRYDQNIGLRIYRTTCHVMSCMYAPSMGSMTCDLIQLVTARRSAMMW